MQALPEAGALQARGARDIAAEEAASARLRSRARSPSRTDAPRRGDAGSCGADGAAEQAAALATDIARRRIETTITADDQMRLVDRYASQLGAAR
jgi:hypothetical protein